MKKISRIFVLISFLIASQMPLLHAFDMQKMEMTPVSYGVSDMSLEMSIFCSGEDGKTGKTECSKEVIQDKGITSPNYNEIKLQILDLYRNITKFEPKNPSQNLSNPDFFQKYRYKSKSNYTEYIGISVKKLN